MEYKYIVIYGTEHKAAQNSPFIGRNNFLGLAKLYVCVCVCTCSSYGANSIVIFHSGLQYFAVKVFFFKMLSALLMTDTLFVKLLFL